jgi:hypothetical protein
MKNLVEYSAAPDALEFREVDATELAEIIRVIRSLEHTATTEGARDGWELDINASTCAAELMDAFGHLVFVAQDQDGYYFATEEPIAKPTHGGRRKGAGRKPGSLSKPRCACGKHTLARATILRLRCRASAPPASP